MEMIHVMNCREIAELMDSDAVPHQPWITRVQFRVHLGVCWHCRLLARQIKWLGNVTRQSVNSISDAGTDFEARILRKLSLPPKQI